MSSRDRRQEATRDGRVISWWAFQWGWGHRLYVPRTDDPVNPDAPLGPLQFTCDNNNVGHLLGKTGNGVNEKGLFVSCNINNGMRGGRKSLAYFGARAFMSRCATVPELERFLDEQTQYVASGGRRGKRHWNEDMSYRYIIGVGDAAGNARLFEVTGDRYRAYVPTAENDYIITRANGCADDPDPTIEGPAGGSGAARARLKALAPKNVLMQGDCPRIGDFGLARVVVPTSPLGLGGSPLYMSPEAFHGEATVATDVWSMGVMLHQMLSGRPPFEGGSLTELRSSIETSDVPELPKDVPRPLQRVVGVALEKSPGKRFSTAANMRASLRDSTAELASDMPHAETSRGCRSIAVTGSMTADRKHVRQKLSSLLASFCGTRTTWYCGTFGVVDMEAAELLLERDQRVVGVGYRHDDITPAMSEILTRLDAPFVSAEDEHVPHIPDAPSKREVFFATKADLVVLVWDGRSSGTRRLAEWLRKTGRDHVIGFV